jgi:SAM-dependent methyltransferase
MQRLSPIQEGKFDYAECFEAFVRGDANGQKHNTQHIVEALAHALRSEGVVFTREKTIDVLDVGCGPGLYAKMFLTSIGKAYPGKIHYHGVDINPAFVETAKKEVASLPNVSQADVVLANAFNGDTLLPGGRKANFAQASHIVYYASDSSSREDAKRKTENFVSAMMSSVTNDGIALYVHSGKDSDVHGKLARRFGSHMWNAPDRIAAAAKAIDKEAVSLQLNSKIYFPTLDGSSYERLKHVDNYRHHPKSSQEIRWLKLLSFALHRDLAALAGERKLVHCVDYTRKLLTTNRDAKGSYLMVRGDMQIVVNDSSLRLKVEKAVARVKGQMSVIDRKTEHDMQREAATLA